MRPEPGWPAPDFDDEISGRSTEPRRRRIRPDSTARIIGGVGLVLSIVTLLLILIGAASAHDHWIGRGGYRDPVSGASCCGTMDCAALRDGAVIARRGGWHVVETGEVISYARTLDSPDGRFWRCRFLGGERKGQTRCLFAPGVGS